MMSMPSFAAMLLVLICLLPGSVSAQNQRPLQGLSVITDSDIRNSAIDFVNTTSTPGLEGATLDINNDQRRSSQWRSSLGFNAEITLRDTIYNAYWGLGLVGGSLNDRLELIADNGQPARLDLRRDVISLRGTAGLVFPMTDRFKLRPSLTLALSYMETDTTVYGPFGINNQQTAVDLSNTAQLISTTGTIDALYWHWYNDYKVELSAHYNLIYTDSFSADNPILDTYSWSQTGQIKTRITGPTPWVLRSRPWRWQVYANHTNFLTQDKASLGYTGLFEIGTGIEWQINAKPLDWFGWQYIGFSVGVITSRNVDGFNAGLTAR